MKKVVFLFAIFGAANCVCMNSQIAVEQYSQAVSRFTIPIPDYVKTYALKDGVMHNTKDTSDVLQFCDDDDTEECSNQEMDRICIANQR